MFGVVSCNFVAARHPFLKRVSGCIQSTSFCHRNHFFVFRNKHAQYFRSKTHFWGGFAQFCCRTSPIPKTGVGVHTWHEFLPPEPFLRFSQRTCPIQYFRSKTHFGVVSRNFVAARHPFRKRVSGCIQSTSFCHRTHFFIFRNEHAQSTTLGPKLMFGVVSHNFVDARHLFRKRVSGCIQSMFLQREPFLGFSQQTCPFHYFGSKTHVWGGFAQFRCRTSHIPKTGVGLHTKHEFLPPEPFLRFSQRTCPIHYFRSKTHVWGRFAQLRCRASPIPKMYVRVHTKQEFLQPEPFLRFSHKHAHSTTLGQKLMFGVVSRNFVATCHPFLKRVLGCIQSTGFCHSTHFFVFSQRTCLSHPVLEGKPNANHVRARIRNSCT
jgi:hypothetical protein